MLIRLRLCDTTLLCAGLVAGQQSRIGIIIVRIRGHLIARLTRTTPKMMCLGGYHRSALSRPIRHARRLMTCRNRAHSMSLYQFSTYPWEENKERRHKRWRRKTIKREDRTRGTEISREPAGRPAFLGVGLATSEHQCLWNKASGVLGRHRR